MNAGVQYIDDLIGKTCQITERIDLCAPSLTRQEEPDPQKHETGSLWFEHAMAWNLLMRRWPHDLFGIAPKLCHACQLRYSPPIRIQSRQPLVIHPW